jgi:hypothetical protein
VNDEDLVHHSEQIMSEVVGVIVGTAWIISGSILMAGSFICFAVLSGFSGMSAPIPWWVQLTYFVPLVWGGWNIYFGASEFVNIYSRRTSNNRRGLY